MLTELFQPAAPARDLDEGTLQNLVVVIRNSDADEATRKNSAKTLLNHFKQGTSFDSTTRIESLLLELLLR